MYDSVTRPDQTGPPAELPPTPTPDRRKRLGRDRTPDVQWPRLRWLLGEAVAAERAGRLTRANHFWAEAGRQLGRVPVTDRPAAGRELIDAHLGFRNGYAAGSPARAGFHFARAQAALPAAGYGEDAAADLEALHRLPAATDATDAAAESAVLHVLAQRDRLPKASAAAAAVCRRALAAAAPENAPTWADRLTVLEPDSPRWPAERRRLFGVGVRHLRGDGRLAAAAELAERFATSCPEVAAAETDVAAALRDRIRVAITDRDGDPLAPLMRLAALDPAAEGERRPVLWAALRHAHEHGPPARAHRLVEQLTADAPEGERAALATARRKADRDRLTESLLAARSVSSGLERIDATFLTLPPDATLQAIAVGAAFAWVEAMSEQVRGGDDADVSRRRADVAGQGIAVLAAQLARDPGLAAAAEGLAALHRSRAVNLANGNRPSDALVELERAAAYDPSLKSLESDREAAGRLLTEITRLVQHRSRSELNSAGLELQSQASAGVRPRDRFLKSREPARIRAQVVRAKRLAFWRRAGLPPDADEESVNAFDRLTDRLIERKPASAADVVVGWMVVLAEHPADAARMTDVTPAHLLAVFHRSTEAELPDADVAWLSEPSALPADDPPEVPADDASVAPDPPRQPVPRGAQQTLAEDPPAEFWLLTARGLPEKFALVVAVAACLAVAVWATTRLAADAPRAGAYGRVRAAAAGGDRAAVHAAAADFRRLPPTAGPTVEAARDAGVGQAEAAAAEADRRAAIAAAKAARRATREEVHRRFEAARADDPRAVVSAAVEFLRLPTVDGTDPRGPSLAKAARATAADWALAPDRAPTPDDLALIQALYEMTPAK